LDLNQDQALVLSAQLGELLKLELKLQANTLFQYKRFVDNSPAGRGCHVAAQCLRIANRDNDLQALRHHLLEVQQQVQQLLLSTKELNGTTSS
jgi:hypothetical protein